MSISSAAKRIELPEMESVLGMSVRHAERQLEKATGPTPLLDATYANTDRFPPPNWTVDTFVEAAQGGGMTYTPYRGDSNVRSKVEENIERFLGVPATGRNGAILTPGTQGALFITLASILEPGDKVILPDPDYLSTERMLRYFGAEVLRVPVIYDHEERPVIDGNDLRIAASQKPKLMVFSHPNNPTGMVYDDNTLHLISKLSQEYDFRVIADQLYCRLVYEDLSFTHLATLEGMAERTITLLGPSKTESMSGYRLGVAVADKTLVDAMEDVQSCTALRAPAYAQHLLSRWIRDDQEFLATRIKEYQNLRDLTVDALNGSRVFSVRSALGSAYVFPRVLGDVSDQDVAMTIKRDAGVVVNPGYQFGHQGLGHIRLCFAQDEAQWEAALDRIITAVQRIIP